LKFFFGSDFALLQINYIKRDICLSVANIIKSIHSYISKMVFHLFSHTSKNTQVNSAPISSASSIVSNEDLTNSTSKKSNIPKALAKFLADPMRSSSHPDVVGGYIDPMGGPISSNTGYDPMSTGA
jgi:hypothetical protein